GRPSITVAPTARQLRRMSSAATGLTWRARERVEALAVLAVSRERCCAKDEEACGHTAELALVTEATISSITSLKSILTDILSLPSTLHTKRKSARKYTQLIYELAMKPPSYLCTCIPKHTLPRH